MNLLDLASSEPEHHVFRIEHRVLPTHVSLHYVIDGQKATSYLKLTRDQALRMELSNKKIHVKQLDQKLHEILNWREFLTLEKGKYNFSYLKNPSFTEGAEDE